MRGDLARLARSRTEPSSRVAAGERRIAGSGLRSADAVTFIRGRTRHLGVTHQTVERCLRRAETLGVMAALDDQPTAGTRAGDHRRGAHLRGRSCRMPQGPMDLGYPHEFLWTTRLACSDWCAKHVREHGPAGAARLARPSLAQGTLCKMLGRAGRQTAHWWLLSRAAATRNSTPRWPRCSCRPLSRGRIVEAIGGRARGSRPRRWLDRLLRREGPVLQAIGTTAPLTCRPPRRAISAWRAITNMSGT